MDLVIERASLLSADAISLIERLNAELSATYPEEGATHFRLDPTEVEPGNGAFLIARHGALLLGCGAVRRLDEERCELKRMFVQRESRGRGVGRALLSALLEQARRLGSRRVVLETGTRQLEALALYERAGFVRIPAFGEYLDSPLSVCMEHRL